MKKGYRTPLAFIGLVILTLGLALTGRVAAQAISGDIVGTVVDKTGASVPGASIEVENVATGVKTSTTSRDQGDFRVGNLPVGTYTIRVSKSSFATTTLTNFIVELNKISSVTVTLEIGSQATTVEVTGATPLINTTTAQIDNTFDAKTIADFPVASVQGVLNLALLQSGVSTSGGVGAGTGPSVGGQRPRDNNFTIEGVDNNNKSVTGPLVSIPVDAVQEFSALQNQFSPEFGHSNAGQFNTVILSGTNQFHGKAYGFFQNRNFNAVDAKVIQALGVGAQNPRFDDNRLGGQVGGPVVKNKLFFFANFTYHPQGQASVTAGGLCAPTAAGYTTIQGIPNISTTNLGILQKYAGNASTGSNCTNVKKTDPAGNNNTDRTKAASPACPQYGCIFVTNPSAAIGFTGVDVGLIPVQAPNYTNFRYLTTSMDYDFSSKDQIRGRYIYNSSVGIDNAAALPAFFLPLPSKFHLVTLAEYHTFSASIANELRVGFNRFAQTINAGNFAFPGLDSFPNLLLIDLGLQIGPNSNAPQFTIQNLYQATDNVTWTKGNHTFKFGTEARKYVSPQSFTQRARGDYDYNTTSLYLLDQNPDKLAERSLGNPIYYGDQIGIFWYASDSWKLRHNLTLNLGLRHEYTTIPFGERAQKLNIAASVPGLIDFSEPRAPKTNFMPRVGMAWSPGASGNTSIRAGFGMGYDVLYDNIGILSLPPQLSGTIDTPQPPVINSFLANGGIKPGAGGIQTFPTVAKQQAATANHVVVDQKDPYSLQWDLSVQHKFGSNYSFEARYLGTRGDHLNVQTRINILDKVDSTHFLPTYLALPSQATLDALPNNLSSLLARPRLIPAFAANNFTTNLVEFTPSGYSIYHGLALQASRQFSNGLQFLGAYTWSHAIDNSTADFFSTVITPRRPQDFQNVNADRSSSALDHRHRFSIAAFYDLPYFKSGNWLRRNVVGNWLLAPIYTYQTGEPADVQSSIDANLNGDAAGDRAIFNAKGVSGTGSDVTPLCTSALPSFATCGENDFSAKNGAPGPKNFDSRPFMVAYLASNPNAQYITAGQGALANAGRNTLQTRPISNLDVTAAKRFSLTERMHLEFQAQFLNVLNHPQFTPGFANRVDSIGFTGSAPTNYLTPSKAVFNQPERAFPSNSRTLQLAMKFTF